MTTDGRPPDASGLSDVPVSVPGYTAFDHSFGQANKRPGEWRTLIVIFITLVMMAIEIAAGIAYHSLALLADGLHMASHAAAFAISYFAYVFARRYAHDKRFSFGTGKVNALAGFAGAMLLVQFALLMVWESGERLLHPEPIQYDWAMAIAIVGLVVNGACAVVLGHDHSHGHSHGHDHDHDHDHDHVHHHHDRHGHGENAKVVAGADHNLRAAYFHVLADGVTSLLAITALFAGRQWGAAWLDPVVGIVGAVVVAYWAVGLLRDSGSVLVDFQAPQTVHNEVIEAIISSDEDHVLDLHIWSIGPGIYAAEVAIASDDPQPASVYRQRIPARLGIEHIVIEVHRRSDLE